MRLFDIRARLLTLIGTLVMRLDEYAISDQNKIVITINKLNMRKSSEQQSSDEEQGFFKPNIKIQSPKEQHHHHIERHESANHAKQLIISQRPSDYQPRMLSSMSKFHHTESALDIRMSQQRQQLTALSKQKLKKCKYLSLKEKYYNNSHFQAVYSRIQQNSEFNSYIFNLERTTDYNQNDYRTSSPKCDTNSKFDSCFQSGNLLYAYKIVQSKMQEYDLIMQNDTNTKGYNQWFYFSFSNGKSKSVRFHIVNFIKKHLMFEDGVRPVAFSLKQSKKGWHFIGKDIQYQKSHINREVQGNPPQIKNYYCLSFTVDFENQDDTVYIALNFPYTYSMMIKHIDSLAEQKPQKILVEKSILCHTISNNGIPLLRIRHEQNNQKKKIILMGRQHPGQTVGSFVLEGFLYEIIKNQSFLKIYELIVIPMINPDGVIYGNFRTNLAGFDLNRQWSDPNKWLHPEIFYLSKFISSLEGVCFMLDFHGHSKKLNSFIYSCIGEKASDYRVYPYIYSKLCPLFSVKDCTFSITQEKIRTARVTAYNFFKIPHIYTLQTSFFGYNEGQNTYRFAMEDFSKIGKGSVETLVLFLMNKKEVKIYEKEVIDKSYLFDQWAYFNKEDYGSQSNPSEDQLTPIQRKQKVMSDRKIQKKPFKSKFKKKKRNFSIKFLEDQTIKKPQKLLNPSSQQIKTKKQKFKPITSRKTAQSDQSGVVIIKENKIIQKPSFFQMKIKAPAIQKRVQTVQKQQKLQIRNQKRCTSNLFNPGSFYNHMQQKLKQPSLKNISDKTQSLQINNIKHQSSLLNANALDILKKLYPFSEKQTESSNILYPSSKNRHRQKVYVIKENKIVSSITRINEEQMKKSLEEQIHNKTAALRNCQKKMRQLSMDEESSFLQPKCQIQSFNMGYKKAFGSIKSYKFPTIEKKNESFTNY